MSASQPPHPTRSRRSRSRRGRVATVAALLLASPVAIPAAAAQAHAPSTPPAALACSPSAWAEGYSDALNKLVVDGDTVGGLSALAYDSRRHAYGSVVDHSTGELAEIWFFDDPADPHVLGSLVLRRPDGTAYNENDFDGEGLAVLPNGDYLVSSETEPSVRVFGRDGVQRSELAIPARFLVAPAGEATKNATLEGLTVSPDGRTVYAAMEGVLSGDVSATGDATDRRILVYRLNRHHGYDLVKEIGYQVDPGNRISEVAAYGSHGLLVLEAAFTAGYGNTIKVYAAPRITRAADVTQVGDLGDTGTALLAKKTLVADVAQCPSLGATAPEPQPNPLLDNYEGMTIAPGGRDCDGLSELLLISDDNFSAAQNTRLLRLTVRLP